MTTLLGMYFDEYDAVDDDVPWPRVVRVTQWA